MASAVAMMICGAVVNTFAFTGGNFLFSKLGESNDAEKRERERERGMTKLLNN